MKIFFGGLVFVCSIYGLQAATADMVVRQMATDGLRSDKSSVTQVPLGSYPSVRGGSATLVSPARNAIKEDLASVRENFSANTQYIQALEKLQDRVTGDPSMSDEDIMQALSQAHDTYNPYSSIY